MTSSALLVLDGRVQVGSEASGNINCVSIKRGSELCYASCPLSGCFCCADRLGMGAKARHPIMSGKE